jgi:hypothetical protein
VPWRLRAQLRATAIIAPSPLKRMQVPETSKELHARRPDEFSRSRPVSQHSSVALVVLAATARRVSPLAYVQAVIEVEPVREHRLLRSGAGRRAEAISEVEREDLSQARFLPGRSSF